MSTKKVYYALFFSCDGIAIQALVTKGKSATGRFNRDLVLKKLKTYYQKRRPLTGFQYVCLMHDNAPTHTSEIAKQFLNSVRVTLLPHSSSPHVLFSFSKTEKFLSGWWYTSRQALGSATSQCLGGIPKSIYRDAFDKWVHRLKLSIFNHGENFEGI